MISRMLPLLRTTVLLALAAVPAAAQVPPAPPAPAPMPAPAPAPAPVAAPSRPSAPPRPAAAPRPPRPLWSGELDEVQREMERARWELELVQPALAETEWAFRHDLEWQLRDAQREVSAAAAAAAPLAREAVERELAVAARAWESADVAAAVAEARAFAPLAAAQAAAEVEAAMGAVDWDEARRAPRAALGPENFRTSAPAPWAAQDPADSLYRIAREALNRNDYRRAAALFQQLAARYPRSAYAADAAYYEAFARYRVRTEPELRQALRVLEARLARNVSSATSADAAALATRIRGELAGWADAAGARRLTGQLAQTARTGDGCDREEAAVRIEALNALAKIDSAAVLPSVRRVLANQAPCAASLRERAVYLLGRSSAPDAEALLVQTARSDSSTGVRAAALSSLARNPSDRAIGAIEEILRTSPDERTQSAAIAALARSEHPRGRQALRALAERTDASTRMRGTAIMELSRDTAAATGAWLRGLYGRVDSVRLKEMVVTAVGRMPGAENQQWLAALARDADEPMRVRREALGWYARRGTSQRADVPIAELVRLYDAVPELELRDALVAAFMRRSEPEATDKLIAIARSDADPRLRRTAISALGRKDDPRTTRLLMEIIDRTP